MPHINIRDDGRLSARIGQYAKARGLKRSETVRQLLQVGLQEAENGPLDMRELVPHIHNQLAALGDRVPRSQDAYRVLFVSLIESVHIMRLLGAGLGMKQLKQVQDQATALYEELRQKGTL